MAKQSSNTAKVNERLKLAEQAAAQGNMQAAANYAQAAAAYSKSPASNANVAKVVAAYSAAAATPAPVATPVVPSGGDTGGGGGWDPNDPNSPANVQAAADNAARLRDEAARSAQALIDQANEARRQQNAINTMKGVLEQMGMMSLYNRVVNFVKEGYEPDAVMVLIRTTPEYKQRFPAMEALAAKGRAISEAEYISYEQTAAGLERRYGLPQGMLMSSVTQLLTNEVSASELNDRVLLASAASIQAPREVKDTFRQYYGIDEGGMTAYFLDPNKATPLLEKQYAASLIGTEATRQGVGLNVFGAENLQSLGITQEQARTGFGNVAAARGLTEGRGDIVTEETLIQGQVAGNEQAQKEIERAAMGRLGRFQGGGEFLQTQQGVVGLGTAATR